jgi:hypothetical protein
MARCSAGDRNSGLWLDVLQVLGMAFCGRCSAGDRDSGLWLDVVQVIEIAVYG